MLHKRIAMISLVLTSATAAVASVASPAAAVPASPGACHMMNADPNGIAGMRGAADQGFENMIDLVIASLQSGCSP
jgi:hypothetical protein